MLTRNQDNILRLLLLILALFQQTSGLAQGPRDYLLWANTSGVEGGAFPRQSDLDSDRNLYVVGSFYKDAAYGGDSSNIRSLPYIFLRKYDLDGNLEWTKSFGGDDRSWPGDVRVDREGQVVFSGYINDPDGFNFNKPIVGSFLCKLNNEGDITWVQSISKVELNSWGSTLDSNFGNESKMEIDHDNTIVLYSNFNPAGDNDPSHGLYISRYSPEGVLIDQYQITHDNNNNPSNIGGVTIDHDGNFIITGYYFNGVKVGNVTFGTVSPRASTPARIFLAKFSADGNFIWAKSSENGHGLAGDVATDSFNNIYVTGIAHGKLSLGNAILNPEETVTGFIGKLNQDGESVWTKLISGTPTNIKATAGNDLYITGSAWLHLIFDSYNISGNGEEIFVLKINSNEAYEGGLISRGVPAYRGNKIAHNTTIDDGGHVYTIGIFHQRIVFGCDTLKTPGNDMFIIKYSLLPPLYMPEISGPEVVCDDAPFILMSDDIPLPAEYLWTHPDELQPDTQSGNQIQFHGSLIADSALVSLMILKECYTYESARPYVVDVLPMPGSVNIENPFVCNPSATRVQSSAAVNATSYVWNLPQGATVPGGITETTVPYIDIVLPDTFIEGIISAKAKNQCYEGDTSPPVVIKLIRRPSPIDFVNTAPEYCNRGNEEKFEVTTSANAAAYVWTVPVDFNETGVLTSETNSVTVSFSEPGAKSVTVYAKNDCYQTDSVTYTFQVSNPLPIPQINVSACNRELTVHHSQNISWFKDGVLFGQDSTILPASAGLYYATVSNFCGLMQSEAVNIVPFNNEHLFIPNVITPNSDGYNGAFTLTPETEGFSLVIFNRWGDCVYSSNNYHNDWTASNIEAGTYYIQVKHECMEGKYLGWLHVFK
jgi:hypothetical protein